MTHIAGVLVQARPENLSSVSDAINQLPGIEVHATQPDGRLVLTIEALNRGQVAETLTHLHSCAGVLSACLVYEQSDSESTEEP